MSIEHTATRRWKARWRDTNGRPHSQTFDRKLDAQRHEAAMKADVQRGTFVSTTAGAITVESWSEQWLTGAMNLGDGGRETYQRDLDRYILPAFGGTQLRRLTTAAIEQFLADELDAGLAPSSVHRHYRTMRRMLKIAVDRQLLTRNPCDPIEPPRVDPTEMVILTAEQIEALAAAISGRYRTWVFVATYTGLRWSECVGLQRRHLDGARIVVTDQLVRRTDKEWHRSQPKTRAGRRVVTLPDFLVDELGQHLDRWALPGPDGLVFPNRLGGPMNGPSFRGSVFTPACARAGLAEAVFADGRKAPADGKPIRLPGQRQRYQGAPRVHDLRHTAAALMVAAGAHPKAMQVRMGHASITVTLDRYGHLFPEMDETIAVNLGALRPGLRLVS